MTEQPEGVGGDILKAVRRLTVAVFVCLAVSIGVAVYVYIDSGNKSDALADTTTRTTNALCALRDDLQARIDQTEDFLKTHPGGFAGVPKATLQQSLSGQKRTVTALQPLACPAPDLP